MRTLKLTLEYDGTGFVGWQRQRAGRSVQGAVEAAVAALTQDATPVVGAGRTDAGVHALGQVAHLRTASALPVERLRAGLNALLPDDVVVRAVEEVPPDFHARRDARLRLYRYVVLARAAPSALWRRYAYHVAAPLDLDAVTRAADALRGTLDFRAFRTLGTPVRTTRCTMAHVDVRREGDLVLLTFGADRFLRHMVRMIVGTLLRVGRGALPAAAVSDLLAAGRDASAGPAAPAHGLYLLYVGY